MIQTERNFTGTALVLAGILLSIFAAWSLVSFPLSLYNPFAVMIAGLVLVGIVVQPTFGILLLLVINGLSTLFPASGGITLNRALGVLAIVGWLGSQISPLNRRPIVIDKVDILFGFYFFTAFLSSLVNGFYSTTQGYLIEIVIGYIIFFLIRNIIDTWAKLRWIFWVVVLATIPIAISVVSGLSDPAAATTRRFVGGLQRGNTTGFFNAIAIVITLYLAESSKSRLRFFYYVLIPLFVTAIFLSGNRSGFVLLVIALLLILGFSQTRYQILKYLLVLTPFLVSVVFIVYSFAPRAVERTLNIPIGDFFLKESEITDVRAVDYRVYYTRAAWKMFLDNSVLGLGVGGFSEHYSDYSGMKRRPSAHNVFLNSLAEMGIFGGLVILMIYIVVIRDLWRARCVEIARNTRSIDYMLVLFIGANIIEALLHGKYFSREMFIVFAWVLLAMSLSHQEGTSPQLNKKHLVQDDN